MQRLESWVSDDCERFADKEECDEYWNTPPPCDEDTPPEQLCRDEGDPDSCEDSFVDRGFGCEPEDICENNPKWFHAMMT